MKLILMLIAFSSFASHSLMAQSNQFPIEHYQISVAGSAEDYITGGDAFSLSEQTGKLTGYANQKLLTIHYEGPSLGQWWDFEFQPKTGRVLKARSVYTNAIRYPFNNLDKNWNIKINGLDYGGSGIGCNQLTGNFKIRDFKYDHEGKIQRLSMSFVQHCEGMAAEAVGIININDESTALQLR